MGFSPASARLSILQRDVLRAFFEREKGFYLTGGAALAGYHLGHRETTDLDLFTGDPSAFERARHVLQDLAVAMGATLQIIQDAPGFLRVTLDRHGEVLVIDLVRDLSFQLHPTKLSFDGIAVDSADEILANKLTAIVGRAEERDLVDVMMLERAGLRIEDALAAALAKDGGCTPANLAWLLSEAVIPDGAALPGGARADDVRAWLKDVIRRLRRAALPS